MIINPYKFLSLRHIGNSIENISPRLYERLLNIRTSMKDIIYRNSLIKYIKRYSLFEEISIETINRCNGVCSFCPVNKNLDKREYHLMEKRNIYFYNRAII